MVRTRCARRTTVRAPTPRTSASQAARIDDMLAAWLGISLFRPRGFLRRRRMLR